MTISPLFVLIEILGGTLLCLLALILPVSTFIVHRLVRKTNKFAKISTLLFFIFVTVAEAIFIITFLFSNDLFQNGKEETVTIDQNIGGQLICKSQYWDDIHDWDYLIHYEYFINGDTIDFGHGDYCGLEWNCNEQLTQHGDLLILPTIERRNPRVIVRNIVNDTTIIYDFSFDFLQQFIEWNEKYGDCAGQHYDDCIKMKGIDNGLLSFEYNFIEKEGFTNFMNRTKRGNIIFEIDPTSGKLQIASLD